MISIKKVASVAVVGTYMLTLSAAISFAEEKSSMGSMLGQATDVASIADTGSLTDLINLNTASPEMLSSIPGIGPKLAEAIEVYRDANGSFTKIKDLLNVDGIDASLLEKITPFIGL